ncbi:MAG: DUF4215 domain-containing protein, partial [Candidatus Peribacteraceae bacterium]|nr:DUF4215 domain-containing protein [Candidatus Peribacteraceae bacterium]
MRFSIGLSNGGTEPMTSAPYGDDRIKLTPHPEEDDLSASSLVFDHFETRKCRMTETQGIVCDLPPDFIHGCRTEEARVLCPVPLIPAQQIWYIDAYYRTVRPNPCVEADGNDGYGFRTELEAFIFDGVYTQEYTNYVNVRLFCAWCGDGARRTVQGEACDDGNETDGDGCSAACQIEPGCDCAQRTSFVVGADEPSSVCWCCGDGINSGGISDCGYVPTRTDWGFAVGPYRWICTFQGEECDDGNLYNGDGCTRECKREYCGDGLVNSNEECDAGKRCDDFISCPQVTCKMGEECVDGRCTNNHMCQTVIDCAISDCKARNVPGCSDRCMVQPGWTCSGSPSVCTLANCGDGSLDTGEACDDGNMSSGDGCSTLCVIEKDWTCSIATQPSVCRWDYGCYDSDGGKNYGEWGHARVTYKDNEGREVTVDNRDRCRNNDYYDNILIEAYCSPATGLPTEVFYPCPNGCKGDGYCLSDSLASSSKSSVVVTVVSSSRPSSSRSSASSIVPCTDSDGGKNYAEPGQAHGAAGTVTETIWDHCDDTDTLVEAFCPAATGRPSSETVHCPDGCAAGFCISWEGISSRSSSSLPHSSSSQSSTFRPSSSSRSSSSAPWISCSSDFLCSVFQTPQGGCQVTSDSCAATLGGPCGAGSCSGTCYRCNAQASSAYAASSSRSSSSFPAYSPPHSSSKTASSFK